MVQQMKEQHWIKANIKNKTTKELYCIINVYAPNHYRDKEACWNTLKNYLLWVQNSSIIIGGDFNLVLNAEEKFRGKFHVDPSREIVETIMGTCN